MNPSTKSITSWLCIMVIVTLLVGLVPGLGLSPSPWTAPKLHAAVAINVTTLADVVASDGECSLREAIITANTDAPVFGPMVPVGECPHDGSPGMDTVVLQTPGTYVLSITGAGEGSAATGDLDILDDLTIQGNGYIVDADNIDRVFEIISATVVISGTTVQNGYVADEFGGGIFNDAGGLRLFNSSVISNTAATDSGGLGGIWGGGIYNNGVLTVTQSKIYVNRLIDEAGTSVAGDVYAGGGVYNDGGMVTVEEGSIVSTNLVPDFYASWEGQATVFRGAGIYNGAGGSLTIASSSVITYNYVLDMRGVTEANCDFAGGGVYNEAGGTVLVDASTIGLNGVIDGSGKTACHFLGGGLYNAGDATVSGGRIADNSTSAGETVYTAGGGLYNGPGGVMTITLGSSLERNNSGWGGGVLNADGGLMLFTDSSASGNNGKESGGGIYNGGTVTITNSTLISNTANHGGGIENRGRLTVNGSASVIHDNRAGSYGGGINNHGGVVALTQTEISKNRADAAGGIRNNGGTATLTEVEIHDNRTVGGGGGSGDGGGVWNRGTLTVTRAIIANNEAGSNARGGGLYSEAVTGTVMLMSSSIVSNTAPQGGGVYNQLATFSLESADVSGNQASGGGAGLFNNGGTLMLTNTTVVSNTATSEGGGLFNENGGLVIITRSAVSDNESRGHVGGGGIFNFGTVVAADSTIARNWASDTDAGGVWNGATLDFTNVTVSGNTANARGGGIFNNPGGVITLTHATLNLNEAVLGTGGSLYMKESTTTTLKNSIVANGTGQDCAGLGSPTSADHNLDSDGTCGLTASGDITNTDPMLGPLMDNGGGTVTHALLPGSPAIDAVPLGDCPVNADQRGVERPQDSACDIGAYEVEAEFKTYLPLVQRNY